MSVSATKQRATIFDYGTAAHASIGVTAGLLGISVTAALLSSIGVEFLYVAARVGPSRAAFDKTLPARSLANQAVGVLATVSGVYVGRWLVQRGRASQGQTTPLPGPTGHANV